MTVAEVDELGRLVRHRKLYFEKYEDGPVCKGSLETSEEAFAAFDVEA